MATAPPNEPTPEPAAPAGRNTALGPVLVAVAATLGVFLTLAPELGGPGVACDEPYQVLYGKGLVSAWRDQGIEFFSAGNIEKNFHWPPDGLPVHPPLGNWLLGWMNHVFEAPKDHEYPAVISVVGPRFVPALAFGVLVLIVGLATLRMAGPLAGTAAAAGVCLVPRVFGHAHLAALDMLTAFWFVAAILAVIEADARGGRWWQYALAGAVWGLAMLTRLHGVLVVPPVAVWMIWRLRWRAVMPLVTWGSAGLATLFAGWPWLWLDPIGRMVQFLGTGTSRQPVHVFYAGTVWPDAIGHQAPWHYAPVMFLVTVPVGLLALGLLGLWARRRLREGPPSFWLVVGSLVFVLIAVSWPGRPIYDGERLFLMVFPLWAVPVGIGAKWVTEHRLFRKWAYPARAGLVASLVAAQAIGLILYHPCYLSYYNLLVGGLPGAEKLGFEVTYWGDSVTGDLLRKAARRAQGRSLLLGPNLAWYQARYVGALSPSLDDPSSGDGRDPLVGWDRLKPEAARACPYVVLYRRKADLRSLPPALLKGRVIAEKEVLGVWVARVAENPLFRGGSPDRNPSR